MVTVVVLMVRLEGTGRVSDRSLLHYYVSVGGKGYVS